MSKRISSECELGDIVDCIDNMEFSLVEEILRQHPAMINAQKAGSGVSPLMMAAGRGMARTVDFLLTRTGINLDMVDDFGLSAFDHAVNYPHIQGRITEVRLNQLRAERLQAGNCLRIQ